MIRLNREQQTAVDCGGNVVITACPGSGKTRVLTARVIRGLSELDSGRERVVALTFTNRAADEIQVRLDQENVAADCLWAGTIHAFALEWVLRPYAPYSEITRFGFTVADEFHTERLLDELKREVGLPGYTEISTTLTRTGAGLNADYSRHAIFERYKVKLRDMKLIDYDDVLYLAYSILEGNPEIAATLASIIRLVCVDEVQDIQDLQFGILSAIFKAAASSPSLFFVGDADQSIYESLGALTKTPEEIAAEFGLDSIAHLELKGNYRSTQRIIDFYRRLRSAVPAIESRTDYADCAGTITFQDQTVPREDLPASIAVLISNALHAGVAPQDICVLAPHWWHVRSLARGLVGLLPQVDFDAPGLSPLHSSRDNFWFKVGRLFLMAPSPFRTRTRIRWAKEVLSDLSKLADMSLPEIIATPRRLLRMINAISSSETEGMSYLRDVFSELLVRMGLDLDSSDALNTSFDTFFEKAENRIATSEGGMPTDVSSFRKLFSHPAGVVVSTCHGVKGEEYDTVIAFGLLRGYVPHWSVIINGTEREASERESKLLYVICSRAKRRLHLIAERGRTTQRGRPYETAELLKRVRFKYDEVDGSEHGEQRHATDGAPLRR
ncbi:MAG: ATP-dependent helicase [Proteobacteria bacterium]|nr:ATP-dependent helicase [Pseudomonadota bacterium]MBU4582460.1 ATP-dependent helicase [Pseudomonadota bacterium]MCG2741039.1 ATP-dependent helicase [Syntrophaceae bacterium]